MVHIPFKTELGPYKNSPSLKIIYPKRVCLKMFFGILNLSFPKSDFWTQNFAEGRGVPLEVIGLRFLCITLTYSKVPGNIADFYQDDKEKKFVPPLG